jgi:hypothetical protein
MKRWDIEAHILRTPFDESKSSSRKGFMKVRIEAVTRVEQEAAAARVRREVFGTEWAVELCRIAPNSFRGNQLIARVVPDGPVIATLTVLETTGAHELHEGHGMFFDDSDRVARYTQMAVLRPYRGLNLPLYLLLEARRRYIIPGGFTYTWLLIGAERAIASRFCTMLDFSASSQTVLGDQGISRVLLRHETAHDADIADMQTRSFLEEVRPQHLEVIPATESAAVSSYGLVHEDEWIAQ